LISRSLKNNWEITEKQRGNINVFLKQRLLMKLKLFKLIILGIILLFLTSCKSKEDISGTYIGNFENNIDTLKIDTKGNFERIIYSNDKKKIFNNKGTYKIKGGYIIFEDFLLNEDNLSPSSKYDSTCLVVANLPYTITFSGIKINSNYDLEYYYTQK